jgi:hypothetical protein
MVCCCLLLSFVFHLSFFEFLFIALLFSCLFEPLASPAALEDQVTRCCIAYRPLLKTAWADVMDWPLEERMEFYDGVAKGTIGGIVVLDLLLKAIFPSSFSVPFRAILPLTSKGCAHWW